MKNKIIKIVLLALSIVGIGTIVVVKIKDIVKPPVAAVPPSVQASVQNAITKNIIQSNNFKEASMAFDSINAVVATEAFAGNLSDEIADDCKKEAFYAFYPFFEDYQQQLFKKHSWPDVEINEVESQCNKLKSFGIATGAAAKNLDKVLQTINGYRAARSLIHQAHSCATTATALSLKAKAGGYMHDPLSNNTSLMYDLKNVSNIASQSVAKHLSNKSNELRSNYFRYDSYNDFFRDKKRIESEVAEYEHAFGTNISMQNCKQTIAEADKEALRFYSKSTI